jgi:hypothetical protein
MRWLEVHRHWLTKIGGGSAGPVTGGEAVAVRGRFPDNPGQEHADYVFIVKGNQPGLEAAINQVPPAAFSPSADCH